MAQESWPFLFPFFIWIFVNRRGHWPLLVNFFLCSNFGSSIIILLQHFLVHMNLSQFRQMSTIFFQKKINKIMNKETCLDKCYFQEILHILLRERISRLYFIIIVALGSNCTNFDCSIKYLPFFIDILLNNALTNV